MESYYTRDPMLIWVFTRHDLVNTYARHKVYVILFFKRDRLLRVLLWRVLLL